MSRRAKTRHHFSPNPFYEGAGTYMVENVETGRRQHFGRWANTTRAEFWRLARFHLAEVQKPYPPAPPPDPNRIRFGHSRRSDDDDFWL